MVHPLIQRQGRQISEFKTRLVYTARPYLKTNQTNKLEADTWLHGWEHILVLQRTRVQFPIPTVALIPALQAAVLTCAEPYTNTSRHKSKAKTNLKRHKKETGSGAETPYS